MFTFLGRTLHMQNKPMWKWIMGKAQLLCTFVFCIVSPWCLELPKLLTTVDKLCPRASVRGSENISINWLGNITGLKWQLAGNIRYSLSQLRQYRIYLYYLYSFSKYLLSAWHVYQASVIPTQMKKKNSGYYPRQSLRADLLKKNGGISNIDNDSKVTCRENICCLSASCIKATLSARKELRNHLSFSLSLPLGLCYPEVGQLSIFSKNLFCIHSGVTCSLRMLNCWILWHIILFKREL